MTRLVGLEISSTAVRMAKVQTNGTEHHLLAYTEAALPAGAVVDGAIVEPAAVRNVVARCANAKGMRPGRFEGKIEVHLAVAGLRAITREIEMAAVPDAELDEAVRLQALDIIPFPVEKTLLSARRLADVAPSEGIDGLRPQMRVLLAAAHRDLVEPFVEVASGAGLEPVRVDLASSALVRALNDPASPGSGTEVIVSIGADLTTVVAHQGGRPHFVRTIAEGGNSVTKAIATALDVPFIDAENLKRYVGRPERHTPAAAFAAARDGSSKLVAEIRSSIDYYLVQPERSEISRVLVTGGGSRLNGLVERLQQQLNVPVERASCLGRFHAEPLGPEFTAGSALEDVAATVIGIATPEPPGVKQLDMLPPDFIHRRHLARNEKRVAAAAGVLVLGMVGGGAARYLQVHNAERGVGASRVTIAYLQRQIPKYDKIRQEDQAILLDRSIVLPLVSHEVNWPAVLQALRRYTPAGLSATGFSGSATPPPTAATTSSTGAKAAPPDLLALPAASTALGNISLSVTGRQYPDFQRWFTSITNSQRFGIVQFSGITSAGASIAFSTQLAINGIIQTSRFDEFNFPSAGIAKASGR